MSAALTRAVVELEVHVATDGWGQRPRLFALVSTGDLLAAQPGLAPLLGLDPLVTADPEALAGHLTAVEQEDVADAPLDELLGGLTWPEGVDGAAVVMEGRTAAPDATTAPEPARLVVGVLRDGDRECGVRLHAKDSARAVRTGADLLPEVAAALALSLDA